MTTRFCFTDLALRVWSASRGGHLMFGTLVAVLGIQIREPVADWRRQQRRRSRLRTYMRCKLRRCGVQVIQFQFEQQSHHQCRSESIASANCIYYLNPLRFLLRPLTLAVEQTTLSPTGQSNEL